MDEKKEVSQEKKEPETPEIKPKDWQIRTEIEAKLRPQLRLEYQELFEIWKKDEIGRAHV